MADAPLTLALMVRVTPLRTELSAKLVVVEVMVALRTIVPLLMVLLAVPRIVVLPVLLRLSVPPPRSSVPPSAFSVVTVFDGAVKESVPAPTLVSVWPATRGRFDGMEKVLAAALMSS